MHTIVIGCDPNAQTMKEKLIQHLLKQGYEVQDFGSEDPVYANVAIEVAEAVSQKRYDRGILLCGTGIGVCLAANKVKGAYAALITDVYSAKRARLSNNANIACYGAFTIGEKLICELSDVFLSSEYVPGTASQPKIDRFVKYDMQRG